ncbi:SagB family peptide dehydrogenase [Nonomuraea sp. NPDC004702]
MTAAAREVPLVVAFRPEVSVRHASPNQVTLSGGGGVITLRQVSRGVAAALGVMASAGATKHELTRLVRDGDGDFALPRFAYRLRQWSKLGLLRHSLVVDGSPVAVVMPKAAEFEPRAHMVGPHTRLRLSRFAYCRRDGDAVVVESPLSSARTMLPGSGGLALVGALARPRSIDELGAVCADWAPETVRTLAGLLVATAVLTVLDEDDACAEDADAALAAWEFHDLVFHCRSRRGRHDQPVGATYRGARTTDPPPAVKPAMTSDGIALYRPASSRLADDGPAFTEVLERRSSRREHGARPINARQVGEFLWRVARVRGSTTVPVTAGRSYEVTSRPYPSGGGAYDLELYLVVGRCAGLAAGVYHYDPANHRLHRLTGRDDPNARALLREARAAAGMSADPQILITLASRFGRLSWKYSGLAYALALKNVGALVQTMYLVATAMDLAGCALGGGDTALFAAATGADPFSEPSVGEFVLGASRSGGRRAT